jgi:hypothetical protein
MKNYKTIIAAVALGLVCSAAASKATLISPGQTKDITGVGYTLGEGAVQIAQLVSPYVSFPVAQDTGTFTTTVYSGDSSNPLGGLTFVYTETLTQGDINGITVDGFGGAQVGVANLTGTAADAGNVVYGPTGNINFAWALDATVGDVLSFVVDTSAPYYGGNFANVQDNFPAAAADLAPVPEPSTVVAGILMLLPFGISAVRSLRKERA